MFTDIVDRTLCEQAQEVCDQAYRRYKITTCGCQYLALSVLAVLIGVVELVLDEYLTPEDHLAALGLVIAVFLLGLQVHVRRVRAERGFPSRVPLLFASFYVRYVALLLMVFLVAYNYFHPSVGGLVCVIAHLLIVAQQYLSLCKQK